MRVSEDILSRQRTHFIALILLSLPAFVGCQGDRVQSSLHPAGPAAESVATLWWVMLLVLGLYVAAVFVLAGIAVFRRSDNGLHKDHGMHKPSSGSRFILMGGVIFPAMILVPMLAYTVHTTSSLRMKETGIRIRVVGHRWWWNVEYPDHGVETANEMLIPVGEPVELQLESADVIHSFWVPQLHGKMDMVPGKVTRFWLQADRAGIYRGQCAEYCGMQHAHMAFVVKAVSPAEFVSWLNDSADRSFSPVATRVGLPSGYSLFFKHGCAVCHRIQGTEAQGQAGPDLTLLSSRSTLAAGTLENTPENLLRWLEDPQHIKPGVNMPTTDASRRELKAIATYLLQMGESAVLPGEPSVSGDDRER